MTAIRPRFMHRCFAAASRLRACRRAMLMSALLAGMQLSPGAALAGGGPENVLLVVNGDSAVSLQVANTYLALRDIPQEHVLWLHDIPYPESIGIDAFRTRIWKPIRDFITRHRLDDEIDLIVYSAGFPTTVDFSADLKAGKLPMQKFQGKEASLTGLTYFARHVENGSPYYLARANRYFRRNLARQLQPPRSLTKEEFRLHKEAQKALRKKEYRTAVAGYESLIQGFPEHAGLWHELARSHAAMDNTAEAMESLQQAVALGWSNSLKTREDRYLDMLSGDPDWPQLLARMEARNGPFQSAHGFSANYVWSGATRPVKMVRTDSMNSYYLSTMLAYTGTYGNSVPEVKDYLATARSSDGTRPEGTVYLLVNNNVRSRTRQPLFLETVAALERRGHRAEILSRRKGKQDGILPHGKDDVTGVVAGAAKFDWGSTGSRLLPGAIAESLTSYGGRFSEGSQTKFTEFLRHGAAGSSGTAAEPLSIQAKFPVPLLHVHYADGCSLAEAFYQSVEAPYQLLVAGDPLARPYARFAGVELVSPDPRTAWSGVVTLQPGVEPAQDRPVAQLELWVDGQLLAYAPPDQPFTWDTRSLDDGWHDLRLVTQEADPVETRSHARFGVTLANNGHRLAVDAEKQRIRHGQPLVISGTAAGGREAELWQGNRKLASAPVSDGRWQLRLASQRLGVGAVSPGVRVTFDDDTVVRSAPLEIDIDPPEVPRMTPGAHPPGPGTTGTGETGDRNNGGDLVELGGRLRGLAGARDLHLAGQFEVDRAGFYELVVVGAGNISLAVDARRLLSNQAIEVQQTRFIPLALEQGRHELAIEFSPAAKRPYLKVVLEGDQVATVPVVRVVGDVRLPADADP